MLNLNFAQQNHIADILLLDETYPAFIKSQLSSRGIELQKDINVKSTVDWSRTANHAYSLEFVNEEEKLHKLFSQSLIVQEASLIMEFGYDAPLCKIAGDKFVQYWEEFVRAAHFEMVVIGNEFVFEFVFRPERKMYSTLKL